MHLYIKMTVSLEEAAQKIGCTALHGWKTELREGLNLGGGEYFKFERAGSEILLVCNDENHAEVFMEERDEFPYYCYVRKGDPQVLARMKASLESSGIECEIDEDA